MQHGILHICLLNQLVNYIYIRACTNETHSLAPLQDLIPILAANILIHNAAEVYRN